MKVLFVASELNPIAKVGELADSVAELMKSVSLLGLNCEAILPYYDVIDADNTRAIKIVDKFKVLFEGLNYSCELYLTHIPKTKNSVYLIRNHDFLSNGGIYPEGSKKGATKQENERFSFFCAAVQTLLDQKLITAHILHCHNWQTASLIERSSLPTIFTIHSQSSAKLDNKKNSQLKSAAKKATFTTTDSDKQIIKTLPGRGFLGLGTKSLRKKMVTTDTLLSLKDETVFCFKENESTREETAESYKTIYNLALEKYHGKRIHRWH